MKLAAKALDIKVVRDLVRMRGQAIAIIAVMACGVGMFVGMRATMRSLASARAGYYAHERFGHVFSGLKRAPERVATELRSIPGVQQLETRVVADVTLDVPDMVEVATGRLVSLPNHGRPRVNDVRLRSGRFPAVNRWQEALVSEAFAEAHDLRLGDRIGAVINGKHQRLEVVGTALSPEYTFTPGPGLILPDDRRFGILWMRRDGLAAAFDLDGAFNDVSMRLARDASVDDVLRRTDHVLDRYGGLGAIARKDQQSAFFIENELRQLQTYSLMLPSLFLAVAAFLVHIVIGRIVATQREQIAAMKAFGYRDREVGMHYAKLAGTLVVCGSVFGLIVASWLGTMMTRMYVIFYRFPELPLELNGSDAVAGLAVSAMAAGAGAWAAIQRTIALPPAEAMRPEAPHLYRATVLERLGLARMLPPAARIVMREIERKPLRAAMTIAGIAMATGLNILNAFTFDSVRYMLNVQFGLSRREDVQLALFEPRATAALRSLESLPGVLRAEPFRSVAVRLRAGRRMRTLSIQGIPPTASLQALLDTDLHTVAIPEDGLVLSRKLAEVLGVATGDRVQVEVLEGKRTRASVRVARTVETFIGMTAYMSLDALCRLLGETESLNGAWLTVDDLRLDDLHRSVKETPVVAGVVGRNDVLRSARKLLDENLGTWVYVSLAFSLALSMGVLYNAVRITLAERSRDLASLRVLGFRRSEVGAILLGELGVLVAIATPLGLWFGRALSGVMVRTSGFDTEQFRLPLVISSATYAGAVVTVLVAAAISSWSAWRKLDRMDIVEVLKARD